jgi:hypothetical protein
MEEPRVGVACDDEVGERIALVDVPGVMDAMDGFGTDGFTTTGLC